MNKSLKYTKAFTIVELLVVIVVIGILAAITIVSYSGIANRASVAALYSDLKNASTQLEVARVTGDDKYPSSLVSSGVKTSPNNNFNYKYNGSNDSYCLAVTNNKGSVYYITSTNKTPTEGTCPISVISAWGGDNAEYGITISKTSDGGYVTAGVTKSYGSGNFDVLVMKYDSTNNLVWTKTWGGANDDVATSVIQALDGGYIVTGDTDITGTGLDDLFILKLNSSGELVWNKTWGGVKQEYGGSIIQTSDGGYALAGTTMSYGFNTTAFDIALIKLDANGNKEWDKTWGGSSIEIVNGIVQTSDNGYAITGSTSSYTVGSNDVFLAKLTSTGVLSWNRTYGTVNTDNPQSITQLADGTFAIVGVTSSGALGNNDMFLLKTDSNGWLSWNKNWGGSSNDEARSIIVASDGNLVVTGYTQSLSFGDRDLFIAKFENSNNGPLLWDYGFGGTLYDQGTSIAQLNDGSYMIVGTTSSFGAADYDALTIKYKSDGTIDSCLPSMCQSLVASEAYPSFTVSSPSATVTTPNCSTTITTANIGAASLSETVIFAQ